MNRFVRAGVVILGLAAIAMAAYFAVGGTSSTAAPPPGGQAPVTSPTTAGSVAALPRLVDLGAGKCIPCKKMAPILEELKKEYAGRLQVDFIDVWVNPAAGKPYSINVIPTQIFFDPSGKELFRHEGFFDKDEILMKWMELGFTLSASPATQP